MTTDDLSSSLDSWIHFAEFGCVVVIIGILGEGVELLAKLGKRKDFKKWFSERLNPNLLSPFVKLTLHEKLWIEGIALIFVAVGLLIEVVASHVVYGISDLQNLEIKQEAGKAMTSAAYSESNSAKVLLQVAGLNKEAADARVIAGEANERAAIIESNNLVLQKELQPRKVTSEQITNFIFLTKRISKIPIHLDVSAHSDETFDYAKDVRYMLERAGFKTPDSDTNFLYGIQDRTDLYFFKIKTEYTNFVADICLCCGNGISPENTQFSYEITNGYTRPFLHESGQTNIATAYCEIAFCLNQIGITCEIENSSWLGTNDCQFVVRAKP